MSLVYSQSPFLFYLTRMDLKCGLNGSFGYWRIEVVITIACLITGVMVDSSGGFLYY